MDLKTLIFKRGLIKSKSTRFKTFLSSCTSDETQTIAQLQLRLDKFKETWEEFNKIQDEIEILDSAPELETENVNERLELKTHILKPLSGPNIA